MRTKDLVLDRENFYKFLAWYISDGSTSYNKNENKYVINIAQTQCAENIQNHTIEDICDMDTEKDILKPIPLKMQKENLKKRVIQTISILC